MSNLRQYIYSPLHFVRKNKMQRQIQLVSCQMPWLIDPNTVAKGYCEANNCKLVHCPIHLIFYPILGFSFFSKLEACVDTFKV